MQQFARVCMIADHYKRQIEYLCIFPECNLSRFACSKCVKMGNHKHQQSDQSHVLDNKELYEVLQEKLSNRQKQQFINNRQGSILQTQTLKSMIELIQNSLKKITNTIEQYEQGMDQNDNDQELNQLLLKLTNNGFNEFDDDSIDILMNIDSQVGGISTSLLDQSNSIIENAKRIQEWCYSQQQQNRLQQKIRNSKYKLITYDQVEGHQYVYSSAISNDFKYIVSGGQEKKLKIWDYSNNTLIKSIQLDSTISKIKFTEDSLQLYVGTKQDLYKFDVNNNFKGAYKKSIHSHIILNIICVTNTIILTCSLDNTIIKTDVNLNQQLLLIKAHDSRIDGLDYNHSLDMIASSSHDQSIKIWNGNNGQLVIQKQIANNNNFIYQVLFIIKGHQLISLDNCKTILVWKINYETKQLEQNLQISDNNAVLNISLALNQQYITLVCSEYIKIYSIEGDYIKQFNHDIKESIMYNTIHPQSMRAIAILGRKILQICKVELELD